MRYALIITSLVGFVLAGCSEDPVAPEAEIAGSYGAVEWTITSDTDSWDLIAAGGHLDLTLNADGTTSGEYYLPDGAAPAPGRPGERRVSLEGAWTREADVVRFDMPGDTYLNFVDWDVSGRELSNQHVNGGYTVMTRLRR